MIDNIIQNGNTQMHCVLYDIMKQKGYYNDCKHAYFKHLMPNAGLLIEYLPPFASEWIVTCGSYNSTPAPFWTFSPYDKDSVENTNQLMSTKKYVTSSYQTKMLIYHKSRFGIYGNINPYKNRFVINNNPGSYIELSELKAYMSISILYAIMYDTRSVIQYQVSKKKHKKTHKILYKETINANTNIYTCQDGFVYDI